jgi:hypothetical protein
MCVLLSVFLSVSMCVQDGGNEMRAREDNSPSHDVHDDHATNGQELGAFYF